MRERVLVDTDVFSYILDNRPDAEAFRPYLFNKVICLSFISVGELYAGAIMKQWGEVRFANYMPPLTAPCRFLMMKRCRYIMEELLLNAKGMENESKSTMPGLPRRR